MQAADFRSVSMTRILTALACTLLATTSAAAQTSQPAVGKEASIPFVRLDGIRDFQPDGDDAIYLQDRAGKWYRANLAGPCLGLTTATQIAVDTRFGGNSLDRTGTLLVDGQRCRLLDLVTSAPPPKKAKR
jgi:hypothetical protein